MKLISAEYKIDHNTIIINEGDLFCKVELNMSPVIYLWTGYYLINLSNFSCDSKSLSDIKYLIELSILHKLSKGTKIILEQE